MSFFTFADVLVAILATLQSKGKVKQVVLQITFIVLTFSLYTINPRALGVLSFMWRVVVLANVETVGCSFVPVTSLLPDAVVVGGRLHLLVVQVAG